jgi:hypothetical protein
MAHPLDHAKSSVRRFGGVVGDYLAIHQWFDATKATYASWRHRALRHHTLGIFKAEEKFGVFITNAEGKDVPVRVIGEQHVKEDCAGRIPSPQDWLQSIQIEKWMGRYVSTDEDKVPLGKEGSLYRMELHVPYSGKQPTREEMSAAFEQRMQEMGL